MIVGLAAAVALVVAGVAIRSDRDDPARVTQADEGWPESAHTELFTDLAPGNHVALPPAPIDGWYWSAAAWTGTELIVSERDGERSVAFDAANGTWRTIAPRPIDAGMGGMGSAVWTGTEMIVCCTAGAAYDPTSDTWRHLPAAPIGTGDLGEPPVVWTGEELVVVGGDPSGQVITAGGAYLFPPTAAAYDPAADQWRRLADLPYDVATPTLVWTGTSILARGYLEDAADGSRSTVLVRYDIDTDTWTTIREVSYAALVGSADANGSAGTVLGVPAQAGAPIDVLDSDGRVVGTLPAVPIDAELPRDQVRVVEGTWVGGEAVLHLSGVDPQTGTCCTGEYWALDPVTERWRQFAVGALDWAAAGDVVFMWTGEQVDPEGFVAHRMQP